MEDFSKYLIPEEWRGIFELCEVGEKEKEFLMVLREKEDLIPKALKGKEVVLNGYKDPVEILHFPLNGKLTYLKFYRRRWKEKGCEESGKGESFSNDYTFHRPGMKTTNEFGDFLKGLNREEFDEFCDVWTGVRDFWEKDL